MYRLEVPLGFRVYSMYSRVGVSSHRDIERMLILIYKAYVFLFLSVS